ncbi:RNA polymerase sigma factor (TIGR02999 family) [Luteibacter rhizovicinus]|uniref:RNA polymerase sigma factor (TIGR02999 family) n=1 Tax=Luteibacter rhizovicinus TaxID=242606 RepID=A0A4R3YKP5_9GAMM|nr:ECF-type sigma factor [Luteibacter rhizovicinus]TCV92820.1 RNA polymerase sigma factor (TIGR02999 family) [Luteibacter rhizovicinus]
MTTDSNSPADIASDAIAPVNRDEITQLLNAARLGQDDTAIDEVLKRMYSSLHRVAQSQLKREFGDCTLSATELVNEAFLRIFAGASLPRMQDRGHLIGLAARTMRRVLIDAARYRQAQKRPNSADRVALTEVAGSLGQEASPDDLDDALRRLEELDERQARIVELRFFVGLNERDIATALDISERTVQREWRIAREWLKRELSGE